MIEEFEKNQILKLDKALFTFYRWQRNQFLHSKFFRQFQHESLIKSYIQWEWQHQISVPQKQILYRIIEIQQNYKLGKQFAFIFTKPALTSWRRYTNQQTNKRINRNISKQRKKQVQKKENIDFNIQDQDQIQKMAGLCQKSLEKEVCQKQDILLDPTTTKKLSFTQKKINLIGQTQLFGKQMDKQEEIEEDSPPAQIYVKDYKIKSRCNAKTKEAKVFSCTNCNQYVHHSKNVVLKHKRICKIKKNKIKRYIQTKDNIFHQKTNQKQVQIISQQNNQHDRQIIISQDSLKDEKSQVIARSIVDSIKDEALNLLKYKVSHHILIQMSKEQLFDQKKFPKHQVQLKILKQIMDLDLSSAFSQRSKENTFLKHCHMQMQRIYQREGRGERIIRANNTAKTILQNYSDIDYSFHSRIIENLAKQNQWNKRNTVRYFNQLRKSTSFSKYPPIASLQSSLPWQKVNYILPLEDIIKKIKKLIEEGQFILSCDIWMLTCMGMYPDLLRNLIFFTEDNKPVSYIKLIRGKQQIIRYVPKSLIYYIKETKTQYPITPKRFQKLRKICVQQFQMFYTFIHLCNSNILSVIHSSKSFSFENQQILSCSKNFIQQLDEIYLSKSFSFRQDIYQQNTMLTFLDFGNPIEEKINKIRLTLDSNLKIFDSHRQDNILMKLQPHMTALARVNKKQKAYLIMKSKIFGQYNKEMLSREPFNLLQIIEQIGKALQDPFFLQKFTQTMQVSGKALCQSQVFEAVAFILNSSMIAVGQTEAIHHYGQTYMAQYLIQEDQHRIDENNIKQPIIIAKIHDKYQLTDQEINQFKYRQRKSKDQANERIQDMAIENQLTYLMPKCPKCKKKCFHYIDLNALNRGYFKCSACKNEIHQVHKENIKIIPCQNVKIECLLTQCIQYQHKSLQAGKKKNNLIWNLKDDRYNRIQKASYTEDIPKLIKTKFCSFSKQLERQILYNRSNQQWLPLEIKRSTIEQAGKGLFTLQTILKNTLIITYTGVIGSNYTINLKQNSLFHLGWLNSNEKNPRQLIMCSQFGCNCGRYINSSSFKHKNCNATIGILNGNEIAVYFYSTRIIQKGQQLFFDYGVLYEEIYKDKPVEIMLGDEDQYVFQQRAGSEEEIYQYSDQ